MLCGLLVVLLLCGCGVGKNQEQANNNDPSNNQNVIAQEDTNQGNQTIDQAPIQNQKPNQNQEPNQDQDSLGVNHNEEPTSKPEKEPESKETLTIGMVGDVLLHDKINDSGKMKDGTYRYDHLFEQVKDQIQSYDLAIVNQEVILGGRELGLSGYPAFNGAFEVGDAIADTGFDVVLHGTNHALDKRKKGVLNCLNFWKSTYPEIGVIGIQDSKQAQDDIYVYEKNGIRVAILNYTYATNGISMPSDMPYLVNMLDEEKVKKDVRKAKKKADFVLIAPHWGTEYSLDVSDEQKTWTKLFLECGADLVIGTHPHVIEPVEWVEGKDGHQMLVYYSIGNFINATSGTGDGVANRMVGAIAEVTLTRTESDKVEITSYGVEPLVSHVLTGPGLITTYRLSDYTKKLAAENEIRLQDHNFSLTYCKKLCRKVFGDL